MPISVVANHSITPSPPMGFNGNWRSAYDKGREACASGDLDLAEYAFKAALRLNPMAGEIHHDLGVVLFQQRHFDQAFSHFQQAVDLNSQLGQAWFNGGNALCAMHRHAEAIGWFKKAVALNPASSEAHYNLANAYKSLGQHHAAVSHLQRTLAIDPNMPEALNNMGTLLLGSGALTDALNCFQRALALDADFTRAIYNLGLTLNRLGRVEEAIAHVRSCLVLQPGHGEALALLVSLLQQLCEWDELASAGSALDRLTEHQLRSGRRPSESPFLNFTRCRFSQRNLAIAQAWSNWLLKQANPEGSGFEFGLHPDAGGRIKIAYLSERFRNAATGHLASGIFGRHDRNQFEIYAYSWGADDTSYYRRKTEQGVDHFIDIRNLTDLEAARRIHADGIHILVDMMGWMHGHRLGIAALRPAPVQVGYLGYPGSTGAPFIDYLLADRVIVPEEMRRYYTEQVIWLPDCYQPNDPETPIDKLACQRRDHGLPEDAVVFCSFNTEYKIEADIFTCWMQIMNAVPSSVFWLLVRSDKARENLRKSAAKSGVDPQRLVFASPLPKAKHLARLKLADIALDTLAVNGHTTTVDALLAGVPVITCLGSHFASRVAASILGAAGMSELVAADLPSYARLAVSLAVNSDHLNAIRKKLDHNKGAYPLFDIDRYVRGLEASFLQIWQNHLGLRKGVCAKNALWGRPS